MNNCCAFFNLSGIRKCILAVAAVVAGAAVAVAAAALVVAVVAVATVVAVAAKVAIIDLMLRKIKLNFSFFFASRRSY